MTSGAALPPWRRLLAGWALAALLVVPLVALLAASAGERSALDDIAEAGAGRAELFRAYLLGELERPVGVPLALADDRAVVAAALGEPAAARALNPVLAGLAAAGRISDLYVMGRDGTTVAASNWDREASFVGRNFAFRPYFAAAMRGEAGREFALGSTSHLPGWYVSEPIRDGGVVVGAVVAKVVLDRTEAIWAGNPEKVMVVDGDGVVFLTDTPAWRFRSLAPLGADRLAAIEAEQRYPGVSVAPLPGRVAEDRAVIEGVRYLVRSAPLPGGQWRLHVLLDTKAAEERASAWGVAGGFGAAVLMLVGYGLAARRQAVGLERERAARTREELERRVRERTSELVQAAKLATIGQMAAGIVHEVNQPLAAIRSFADNGARFLGLGRADRARDNLAEIAQLVDRMAGITRSLKGFARRPGEELAPVPLDAAVGKALALVGQRLRTQGVEVAVAVPPLLVRAEDVRLQQVLVNLVANAADAVQGRPAPRIAVEAEAAGDRVVVRVTDNGPGVAPEHRARLFDPFFTTKPSGEGLGLGLSIASAIVRDFGGTLAAADAPDGGAVFTLTLARVEAP